MEWKWWWLVVPWPVVCAAKAEFDVSEPGASVAAM